MAENTVSSKDSPRQELLKLVAKCDSIDERILLWLSAIPKRDKRTVETMLKAVALKALLQEGLNQKGAT